MMSAGVSSTSMSGGTPSFSTTQPPSGVQIAPLFPSPAAAGEGGPERSEGPGEGTLQPFIRKRRVSQDHLIAQSQHFDSVRVQLCSAARIVFVHPDRFVLLSIR